jgi:hypothetical protein
MAADQQTVATLQALLEGVPLPATRGDLVEYARAQREGDAYADALLRAPDREYRSLDEVAEELIRVQPQPTRSEQLPREESGLPPGGDAYLDPTPEPGAVRHDAPPENPPQKVLEQQTKAQEEQKKKQEEG